jgi:cytochrome b561
MNRPRHFNLLARVLHWSMAVAILAMLFVGAAMVVSLRHREFLLDLHRPLGLAILLLAIVRLGNRLLNAPPPLPADLPRIQVWAATASHWALYALMLAMPLIGWREPAGDPATQSRHVRLPASAAWRARVCAVLHHPGAPGRSAVSRVGPA